MIIKPNADEYPPFYDKYVQLSPEENILEFLEGQADNLELILTPLNEEDALYTYAEGKWTIKEIIGHLADAERLFGIRALRFARNEKADIPQFDENRYVAEADFNSQSVDNLIEQFKAARLNNLLIFDSFQNIIWERKGTSGGGIFTVRAFPFITGGHAQHHINFMNEKYLNVFRQYE